MKSFLPILISFISALLFSRIVDARPSFEESELIRENCVQRFLLPSGYSSQDVQKAGAVHFNVKLRIQCLLPLLTDGVLQEVSYFQTEGMYDANGSKSLLLQIFESMISGSAIQSNTSEHEKHLNKLIVSLFALQLASQAEVIGDEMRSILVDVRRFSSISLASQFASGLTNADINREVFDLSEISPSLDVISLDDAIVSQSNDQNIRELICVLNPSRVFCPERILFAADVKSDTQIYLVMQNILRKSDLYFSEKIVSFSDREDSFCEQIANVAKGLDGSFSKLYCPQDSAKAALELSRYLKTLPSFEKLFALAVNFNMDRIRKSLPSGSMHKSATLVKVIYFKDVQTTLEELDLVSSKRKASVSIINLIKNEIDAVLKGGSNESH